MWTAALIELCIDQLGYFACLFLPQRFHMFIYYLHLLPIQLPLNNPSGMSFKGDLMVTGDTDGNITFLENSQSRYRPTIGEGVPLPDFRLQTITC